MKKILFLLLAATMSLAGCATKPAAVVEPTATPAEEFATVEEPAQEVVGGWEERVDQEVTAELLGMFNKGVAGTQYEGWVPTKFLATQMASGMNFKFLCENGQELVIYQNLDGEYFALNPDGSVAEKTAPAPVNAVIVSNEISEDEAKAIAIKAAEVNPEDVNFIRVEKDYDNGQFQWEIEFDVGTTEYSYGVDLQGNIVEAEKELN